MFKKSLAAAALSAALVTSLAVAGTSAASAAPGVSGTTYAGRISFDHGKWCAGAKANGHSSKPGEGNSVWWVPCGQHGYFQQWIITVFHFKTGSLGQIASAANLDLCWSESNRNTDISLRGCPSLSDRTWVAVYQIRHENAYSLELYGRWLAAVLPLNKIKKAAWNARRAFIVQFPPQEAQPEGRGQGPG
jgi:hypothetical protein